MKAVIAEKPSVAREIARVIGAAEDKKEYLQGNGFIVSWCFGHLLELKVEGSESRWSLDDLPIIPERFDLAPRRDKTGKDNGDAVKRRLEIIGSIFSRCDSIICCTDAGREGQLIFDEVYRYLHCTKRVERLWISSLTEEAIRKGFSNLYDNEDPRFANLTKAARCRSEADWIVGINGTRALTLATGSRQTVLSVGRVQTPTLCMICDRYLENKNFKPEPYWYISGDSAKDGITFRWRTPDRYMDEHKCDADLLRTRSGRFLCVTSVETHRRTDRPPLLHDITSLQKAANAKYGYTADRTLALAQSLYEKKILSYPRTGSRYIPEDVFATVPRLLGTLADDRLLWEHASALLGGTLSRRSVSDTKITDHHALIITGNAPKGLTDEEDAVYRLVATRFVEAFSPDSVADITEALFDGNGVEYRARGRREVIAGWRAVCREDAPEDAEEKKGTDQDDDLSADTPLPDLVEGEAVPVGGIEQVQSETKPRPLLTDATVMTAMQTAGNRLNDKAATAILKDIGLGTPATRGDILKNLVDRGYVERRKKKLVPTELGLSIYTAVRDRDIADVYMTARWELSLDGIADGKVDDRVFSDRIKAYAGKLTSDLTDENNARLIRDRLGLFEMLCPRCHAPMRLGEKSAWCPECKLSVWREMFGKRLGSNTMKKLITEGRTGLVKGFTSKAGKTFDATLVLDKTDFKVKLEFPKTPSYKKK